MTSKIRPVLATASLAGLLGFVAGPLSAQTPPPSTSDDAKWRFAAGLYGFFPAIEGTATTEDFIQVPIDVSFSELWDHLKLNLTGHFEAQKGRLGFGIDAFYCRLGDDIDGPIPELTGAEITMSQFIGEAFGYYQLIRGSGEHPWRLEALGGIRYWNTNLRVESDIGETEGQNADWVDGFGGLRAQVPLGSRLILMARGDVGGGGANLDWSASGDLAFRLGKGWVSGAGYRTLNVDFEKTGPLGIFERTVWDIGYDGPRMWIAYTW